MLEKNESLKATEAPSETDEKSIELMKPKQKIHRAGIIVFITGIITLSAGIGFLLFNLFKAPDVRDAEYLVSVGAWQRENEPSVVWKFTEIGKGKLTTNNYADEYDFIWAMDGDQLKIETDWLYTLNNEYTYTLNQDAKTLTLVTDEKSSTFVPAEIIEETENTTSIPEATPSE